MVRSLHIELDPTSDAPLYRQIHDRLVERIRSGELASGFRLPPSRALAIALGVHRNTVVRAFEELLAGGFITSATGRGTFVADVPVPRATPATPTRPELPWTSLVSRAAEAESLGRFDRLSKAIDGPNLINLTRMHPPESLLPHEQFRRCVDHVLRSLGASALGYAPREGLPRLRGLISEELAQLGIVARADDVIVTTGSQQALDLLARGLCNPGDAVLAEAATYPGAINAISAAGARLVGIPIDDEGPDMDALAALAPQGTKAFYLMPNCRNPTGTSISQRRREALVDWSHRAGVPLIEDDYGADLNLDGNPMPPSLRAMDPDVLYTGTFSKKLIPALRVGFLVCPPALRRQLVSLKLTMDLGTSALLQHALAELIERGYLRAHLQRIVPEYRTRRDALADTLRAHLPPDVTFTLPTSGLVLWLSLPDRLDPEAVYEEAHRNGVLVTPGTIYSVGSRGQGGLRLAYCHEPPERLRQGAARLCATLRAMTEGARSDDRGHETATIGVV